MPPRRTLPITALALTLALGGCGLLSSSDKAAPVSVPSPTASSPPATPVPLPTPSATTSPTPSPTPTPTPTPPPTSVESGPWRLEGIQLEDDEGVFGATAQMSFTGPNTYRNPTFTLTLFRGTEEVGKLVGEWAGTTTENYTITLAFDSTDAYVDGATGYVLDVSEG